MNNGVRTGWRLAALASVSMLAACNTLGPKSEATGGDTAATTDASTASATGASTATAVSVKPMQVSDVPLPADVRIDEANSIIIGSGDRWLGRLVLRMRANPTEAYNHFFNAMPQSGWTAFSAVQSRVSLLTFTRGDRFATVQIEGGVAGATVTILVTTRSPEAR